MCSEIFRRLSMVNDSWVISFNACMQRVDTWLQCEVTAFLKGKESECPAPEAMRAIIPLEPMWQLVDSLLANRMQEFLDYFFAPVRGVHVGARKGTQAVEIPCALQIACEKCQEYGLPAAFGQIDSMQHYDKLDMCIIAQWLCEKGVPSELTAATFGFSIFEFLGFYSCWRDNLHRSEEHRCTDWHQACRAAWKDTNREHSHLCAQLLIRPGFAAVHSD